MLQFLCNHFIEKGKHQLVNTVIHAIAIQKMLEWEIIRSIIVAVRDGCEPIFRMLQQMSENYDRAGKIVDRDQMYESQREVAGTCIWQQQILMSFVNKNNHPTLAPQPFDENSVYSFSKEEIEAEHV
jgi:hypothetical protein